MAGITQPRTHFLAQACRVVARVEYGVTAKAGVTIILSQYHSYCYSGDYSEVLLCQSNNSYDTLLELLLLPQSNTLVNMKSNNSLYHQCDRRRAPFVIVALVNHKECECGVCFVRLREEDVSDDVLSSGNGKKSSWVGGSRCDKILSFFKPACSLFLDFIQSSSHALFCI